MRFAVVVAVVACLSGCLTMQVPERFLVIESGPGVLRALTPEESKIWVRDFDDDTKGSATFWKDALKADLIKNRGYTLINESQLQDGGGRQGIILTLEATLGGRPVRELMAVFVIPGLFSNTIRVAEYVADKEAFDAEVEGVKQGLTTLK
ncbi:MAG: hypothetical protein Q8O67_16910 [Deltaproteobacteria bacterium]|nr:hypothetical protein [Deltaproteobacteria bacterium]